MLKNIVIVILSICLILIILALSGVIMTGFYWILGALFCKVFEINYNWSILHALVITLFTYAIIGIFKSINGGK